MSGLTTPSLSQEPELTGSSVVHGAKHEGSHVGSAGVMGFISIAGLICNLIVIMVICVLKDYKKTTHWYVLNLAVADSMFLFMLPLNIIQNLRDRWDFGYPACVMFHGSFYVNYYAGVLFLAVMSFDRFIAIAHPISKSCKRIRSHSGSIYICITVWVVAIAAASPLMAKTTLEGGYCDFSFDYVHPACVENNITSKQCEFWLRMEKSDAGDINATDTDNVETFFYDLIDDGFEEYYDGQDVISETAIPIGFTLPEDRRSLSYLGCIHTDNPSYIAWIYCNFVLSFVLPLLIMGVCYGAILWRVQHPRVHSPKSSIITGKKRRTSSTTSMRSNVGVHKKVRITILVVSLVVVFIVCWLPFNVFVLAKVKGIDMPHQACEKLHTVVLLIAYSNCLLNPIMYTFLGINFFKRLRTVRSRILGRRFSHRRGGSFKMGQSSKSGSVVLTKVTKASSSSEPVGTSAVTIPLHHLGIANMKASSNTTTEPFMTTTANFQP